MTSAGNVVELERLREARRVFRDRAHAGQVLAGMLGPCRGPGARVFAIPAGGVPVAAALARDLGLPLDVVVVSKITLPWNTEAGYGAVAFDGTLSLDREIVERLGLSPEEVDAGVAATREKVRRRVTRLRGGRPFPALGDDPAILVDDGLASGVTMQAAVRALRAHGARRIVIAVPTGHARAVGRLAAEVEAVCCANVRSGGAYAVADAYERWSDVTEDEALRLLVDHLPAG
jgi:predicted phosphoribosyltransferase